MNRALISVYDRSCHYNMKSMFSYYISSRQRVALSGLPIQESTSYILIYHPVYSKSFFGCLSEQLDNQIIQEKVNQFFRKKKVLVFSEKDFLFSEKDFLFHSVMRLKNKIIKSSKHRVDYIINE